MVIASRLRSLCSAALLASGCGGAIDRIESLLHRVAVEPDGATADRGGTSADASGTGTSEAPEPVAVAVESVDVDVVPAAPASVPVASPEELEVRDVEVEWIDRPAWGYYGASETIQAMRVHATAKLRAAVGREAKIIVKAVCDATPVPMADADVSPVNDSYVEVLPAPATEFAVRADLFQGVQPGRPSLCRVQLQLIDEKSDPIRRGRVDLCWHRGNKATAPCGPEDRIAPAAEPRDAWAIDRAEFAPSGELLFSVVAGRERAPDRVALRTTCYVGDKRFIDFDFLVGRWYALEPGEGIRQRIYVSDLQDLMRFAECDLAFQAAGYDFEKLVLRGVKDIQHLCVRPTGLASGACRVEQSELAAWDPASAPAKIDLTHSGANAYRGWFNAYMNGELTALAAIPKDASLEMSARCGGRSATQAVTIPVALDMVWPGESVRVWGGVSMAARSARGCVIEVTMSATDRGGKRLSWSLGRKCFDKAGVGVPCPK